MHHFKGGKNMFPNPRNYNIVSIYIEIFEHF